MSALGAFFRGAAGPGMLALADSYERRDAEEAKRAERAAALAAEQAFRADQAGKDRMARYGTDGSEPGMLARGASRSGGAAPASGEGSNMGDIGRLMQSTGMSEAEARQKLAASASGQNPYTRDKQIPEQFDDGDGRMKTVSQKVTEPDEDRWIKLNQQVGKIYSESGPRAKSNYAQLTEGDGNAQRNSITSGMLSGALTPAQTAEGVAASKGEGGFGKGGVNQFSGKPDAVGASTIRENDAQAGSAGRANRNGGGDAGPMAKLPEAAKLQITDLNNQQAKLQELIDKAAIEGSTTGKDGAELPAVTDMRKRIQSIEVRKTRVLADNGAIDAKAYAQQVVDGESDPAKLRAAIAQAKQIGGKFAADFVPEVQARLAELHKKPAPTQADARKGDAAPAKPAAAPAAPTSGRAQVLAQSANRSKAEADPDVKALRQQIAAATSGRQANTLQSKLNDILASRYGL